MTFNVLSLQLPLRGIICAGWPSPAEEELGDTLSFEEWLIPNKEASCLVTVTTNILRHEGILPHDIVIMERGKTPRNGDVVIAEADGIPMIRIYELFRGAYVLTPRDSLEQPTENIHILGTVTAVIRKYR